MEKLKYRELVKRIIIAHSSTSISTLKKDNPQTEEQIIIDTEGDHYLIMLVGWYGEQREYESLIHIDIKEGKIWIQSDGTEVGVANELIESGVPSQDIILGFKSPFKRQLMEIR